MYPSQKTGRAETTYAAIVSGKEILFTPRTAAYRAMGTATSSVTAIEPSVRRSVLRPTRADLVQDGQARADRGAEVPLEHPRKPRQILGVPCLGHAHRLADARPGGARGHLPFEQEAERVARRQVQDAEDDHAHPQEQERGHGDFPGQDPGDGLYSFTVQ